MNFGSVQAIKSLILKCGLEEIRAITQYEVMNKQMLLVAIQINQAAIDKWEKQICEIELARDSSYIPRLSKSK